MNRRKLFSLLPVTAALAGTRATAREPETRLRQAVQEELAQVYSARFIPALLCGCEFRMTAEWLAGTVKDGVSYAFPKQYSIDHESIEALSVCGEHRAILSAPVERDPYFGSPGFVRLTTQNVQWRDEWGAPINPPLLDPAKATPAQKLFLYHFRFHGQILSYPCECRTYRVIHHVDRSFALDMEHPRHTRLCGEHSKRLT